MAYDTFMSAVTCLHELFSVAALRYPQHVAVEYPNGGESTYQGLAELSDRVRDRLARMAVEPGDRVGIYLAKSIDAVASILGTLKAGAAYVPVDPNAPPSRNAYILNDCQVKAVIVDARFADALRNEMASLGQPPTAVVLEGAGNGQPLDAGLGRAEMTDPAPGIETVARAPDDLAYVLYTSGSTGRPKGVMLTHRNAVSYVNWCSEIFKPRASDRFSSHAPFHFDLSILDIYVTLKHGATLVLISNEIGKNPVRLAQLIAEQRISIWYSTPSILSLLAELGQLINYDYSALRLVLFAGEVFPVKYLRELQRQLAEPRYFNLYGPTETNVCTFYELIGKIPEDRIEPLPIGKTCQHLSARVVSADGHDVVSGAEGELCIAGPAVTPGYWKLPEETAKAFLIDESGRHWYLTGDIVREDANGEYVYRGRRDRMVKKRGYRIELNEIEACLYSHPEVHQVAVTALSGDDGVRIMAFICTRDKERLSIIQLKQFCAQRLPAYMVPDIFSFHETLPTTSTGKIDYQTLKDW